MLLQLKKFQRTIRLQFTMQKEKGLFRKQLKVIQLRFTFVNWEKKLGLLMSPRKRKDIRKVEK